MNMIAREVERNFNKEVLKANALYLEGLLKTSVPLLESPLMMPVTPERYFALRIKY